APVRAKNFYFKEGITYGLISSFGFSARIVEHGSIFDVGGSMVFLDTHDKILKIQGLMSSSLAQNIMSVLNPTLNYQVGDVERLPVTQNLLDHLNSAHVKKCIDISKYDWDMFECSVNFQCSPLLNLDSRLCSSFEKYIESGCRIVNEMKSHWEENNKEINELYGLINAKHHVEDKDITLSVNKKYRYSGEAGEELEFRYRSDTLVEFVSYAIGCMMGRYSLDRDGLVYAHESNKGFAELIADGAYKTFPADEDGILPLMDSNWFDDDVTARVKEFVCTVWGEEHQQENLDFIAESLCLYAIKPKKGESSLDIIRRYLSTQFWKDHMKMYKKRPIYWLFSSGKEKAFECLVYLHRYNEGTLSRMRTEYVVPLLARYQGNIDLVNDQLKNAESGAATTRLKKELDGLTKKFNELRNFDDRLRHYADRRITIDLDDGVKVNYGKFGDLLADVKAITGSAPQEA
ncbi:BREX-1 system adenine-specific DNA-methyltransferase PglX, partial [Salmonella enterica]|nr:BREX-1 system adenine-specific DNA-methyltransferase PglX [Salmonella enterica]